MINLSLCNDKKRNRCGILTGRKIDFILTLSLKLWPNRAADENHHVLPRRENPILTGRAARRRCDAAVVAAEERFAARTRDETRSS